MREWGEVSKRRLGELDPRLQDMCNFILRHVCDISIVCAHRGEEDQNKAYDTKHSQVRFPNGKHNKLPSIAVDIAPYPYPKNDAKLRTALGYIAGRAIAWGIEHDIQLRWGGDWDGDGDVTDQTFDDLFHIELRL